MNFPRQIGWKTELLVGLAVTTALVWMMRAALLQGKTILVHDNLYWGYPLFQFFAEAVLQGRFPFWNPFTHGGEPFYPLLVMTRLLDPTTFVVLKAGSLFTNDLVILFNWDRFVKGLVIAFGTCLLLRQWAEHWLARIALIPVVVLSSYHLANFHQTAVPDQFVTAPFVLLLAFRILCNGDRRWRIWISLGVLFGMNMQGYFFTGTSTFILFLTIGLTLFRRDLLRDVWAMPGLFGRVAVTMTIIAVMCLPNVALMQEKKEFVFPARMLDEPYEGEKPEGGPKQHEPGPTAIADDSIIMPYGLVAFSGSFSNAIDFLQIAEPYGNRFVNSDKKEWGDASEAFIYLGMLSYIGALVGLFHGRHPLKRVWITAGLGMGLLMLGPVGGIHVVLFHLYPPLWFVRHTHAMVSFFDLVVLFFFVLGCNTLMYLLSGIDPTQRLERWRRLNGDRTFRDQTMSDWAWMIGLVTILVGGVLLIRRLEDWGQQGVWKFVVLVAVLLTILAYRVMVGRLYLAAVIGGTHLATLLAMTRANFQWSILVAATVLGPLLLIWQSLKRGFPSPQKVCAVLVLILTIDLLIYGQRAHRLWDLPRPDTVLAFNPAPAPPGFPETRTVFPIQTEGQWPHDQMVRYLDALRRTPSALSPPMEHREPHAEQDDHARRTDMQTGIEGKRWNSFLMSAHYYKLIYSGASPEALLAMFAVGQPLIQFKPRSLLIADASLAESLKTVEPSARVDFLQRTILLSSDASGAPGVATTAPPAGNGALPKVSGTSPADGEHGAFFWNVESYDYNELLVSFTAPADGFLYWADGYSPHWHAEVDGTPVPVLRANINFKAIPVPRGTHQARFVFQPTFYAAGIMGYVAMHGLLFVLIPMMVLWERIRPRTG
jgi:hypothetical protein